MILVGMVLVGMVLVGIGRHDGRMTKPKIEQLITQEPRVPKVYGVPKIHKLGVPLRPIVDNTGSVMHKMGKLLNDILRPIAEKSETVLKNTAHFIEEIRDVTIGYDESMGSFDVVQLFPSVTKEMALDAIKRALDNDAEWTKRTTLTKREIVICCAMCLSASEMVYNGKLYLQKKGLPMGGTLSPIAAELVMQYIEEQFFEDCRLLGMVPKFWKRLVDDVIVIGKTKNFPHWLNMCNAIEQNISFTMEFEKDRCLPFLDVHIEYDLNNQLHTTVYLKPMATDRVLPYSSSHCMTQKLGVLKNLIHRAHVVCSSENLLNTEINRLKGAFQEGGYPKHVVNRCLRQMTLKFNAVQNNVTVQNDCETRELDVQCQTNRCGVTYHPSFF